jgi:ribosomal protein S18 acetylase RimI-like enzyme
MVSRVRNYLERNPIPNVYVLFNLLAQRDKSKYYVATAESKEVAGVLLTYQGFRRPVCWLVAESAESARHLAKFIQFSSGAVWTQLELEEVLRGASESGGVPWKIASSVRFAVMKLDRSKTELKIKNEWRNLSEADAYQWAKADVMMNFEEHELEKDRQENNELYYEVLQKEPNAEQIESARSFLRRSPSFGIFEGETLASRAAIEELGGVATAIRRVFTNPKYRKRGYALSITSVAAREAMKDSGDIILFVRDRNFGAKKMYERIGFRSVAKRIEVDLEPLGQR